MTCRAYDQTICTLMEQLYVIELCCLFVHNTAFVLITTIIASSLSFIYVLPSV